ncbi:PDZ domain-containing protein [Paenibacillus sp. LMG 31456]|uniref:PDZ domain-containing protein n=1 Tax=Paenibacillus foliorum TaxID=2654974 RepID=A0A972JYK3_9BACL|nr:trypsin-like peptidase domain-containing protein [Paenibacillus foliorum]NOU91780.1 PDZ domain-containing protein [Paenibacillus foliorum]
MDDNQKEYGDFIKQHDNDNSEHQGKKEQPGKAVSGDITVIKPRFFEFSQSGNNQSNSGNGKRSSGKSMLAAFLAGALVVGGLMYTSDKMNLFSNIQAPLVSNVSAASPNNGGATTASVDMRPNNIADIAQQAGPAVVKIETKVKPKSGGSNNPLYSDPFFRQFFGGGNGSQQQQQDQSQELQPAGIGSGFIFESSGYILTNEHVIDGADEIDVTIQGYDKPFKAKLLGNSYDLDLAVLKIEDSNPFPTLPIGNSDNAKVGDWVVAIGNPYDLDYTVTAGLLSAKERPISIPDDKGTREYKHLIQTDAAINPGNSGGPLLNLKGEVIGINTAVSSQAQGIGFAIPTNTISTVLDQLKNNVEIPKEPVPFIGVSLGELTKDMLSDLKLDNTEGALVADVQRKTPAFEAGIRPYDVITAVNGTKIAAPADLTKKVQALKVGDKLTLTVIRNGNKQDIAVTVGDRTANSSDQQ